MKTERACAARGYAVLLAALLAARGAPAAPADGSDAAAFADCIAALQVKARDAGISEPVVEDVLGNVRHVERVVELDREQPEFTRTFADYYQRRVTDERVARGRRLLAEHRALFDRVQRRYGVPAQYLVAFWGLETNFGAYFGKLPVPDALATLACDRRRSAFFTGELIDALQIIDAGDISHERMLGSWAGAMGHLQFLPSVFRRYAVDGDGDGKRDIWGSIADAMASAGHFLSELGWQSGLRWGREVHLPDDFDYGLAGRDARRPLSVWAELGVTDAYGGALPRLQLPAAILVPSGSEGPAFIAYDNFDVIMKWNRSEFYALAVGRLADRIAGSVPLTRAPADAALRLTPDRVRELQADLRQLGFDAGEPDGLFGPDTRRALSRFQASRSLLADGHPDEDALAAVHAAAAQ
ncbi:MAG TPA: lytic murein transglycosylase [Woeseiaceae bacterium]|nr:lytic murein transglycosylase [Woeseiaceae bacterium]